METPEKKLDFDRPPVKEGAVKKDALDPSSVAALQSFSLDDALRELKDIRQEAEEVYAWDNEIDPVPESAYDDALLLLKMLFNCNIPCQTSVGGKMAALDLNGGRGTVYRR